MKAIQVNPDTFGKIEKEIRPIDLETIEQYYRAMTAEEGTQLYLLKLNLGIGPNGVCRAIPQSTLDKYWEGDQNKTDWFDVEPKGEWDL